MNPTWRSLIMIMTAVVLLAAIGCDDKKGGLFSDDPPPPPPPRRGAAPATSAAVDAGVEAGVEQAIFREEDFIETERSRDPFRSFSKFFAQDTTASARTQRDVMLDRYSIEDLKLVGIVTGSAEHRAMLVDPTGTGWIVRRGDYIGKAELVRGTGPSSTAYELNWRVDRIRDSDIVLVREDPAHSDVPPATRVIPLRPEDSASASR